MPNQGPPRPSGEGASKCSTTGSPMKLTLSLLAAATSLSFNAGAATSDWGTHGALQTAASMAPVGSFADIYLFGLSSAMVLTSSAVSNNLGSVLGLSGGSVTLFSDVPGPDLALGSYLFSGETPSLAHSFGNVLAGSYYYVVSGVGTGTMGGFYALASAPETAVSVVPEPSVLALMLAGLGIVGLKGHRRQHPKL